MSLRRVLATVAASAAAIGAAMITVAPSHAAPPPPGCERVPIFGLNPQIREICDLPIQADGTWERWRWFSHPTYVHSTCGEYGYMDRTGYRCPAWAPKDTIPAEVGPVEKYVLTADTVPPGEPRYIGG